ncbi:HTH domain-containing protein [Paenibacillus sp. GSMTC-2017]|nr:HTH domain-containing protein [Paenibacillus sp. GSMTC-2017]MBH5319506.1 HTH domain-containing protein [Paenibacillus sp. GSMTC-2017]
MTKTQRLHEVMARIYEKKTFTVNELAEEFHVSYRTMLRYVQELSGMGVPLYAEVGKHGGYSILKSFSQNKGTGSFKRVIKPMTTVVGFEFKAPFTAVYMAKVRIPLLWEELTSRANEIINPVNTEYRIGVSLSRSHIYHYIAGIEVTTPKLLPQDMVNITLPPREYVVYNHSGETSRAEIDDTYFFLLDKLRKQGLDHDPTAYTLEVFKGNHLNELSMHIPLK